MEETESTSSAETLEQDLEIREPPRILIPIAVLEGESLPETLVQFLAPSDIILLGYHVLPEQTPTEQASMQFEEKAREAIEAIAASFSETDQTVETRVAFTHNREQTVKRVAHEVGATATLLPNPAGEITDVLVPIRGAVDVDRLSDLVATLLSGRSGTVTLWGQAGAGEFDADAAVATAETTLRDRGLPADQITTTVTDSESPIRDVIDRSTEFDIIVMGEGGPGVLSSLLGAPEERIAEGTVAPVLVVRQAEQPSEE